MDEKKAPQRGQITIRIILEYEGFCNVKADLEAPQEAQEAPQEAQEAKQYPELALTKKGKDKAIVLQSPRLIEAFKWLQDKTGSVIAISDIAEALSLDKDQTRKALQVLSRDKKLIHYTQIEGGKLKLIRVDDISRLKPIDNGVQNNEQACEAH